MSYSSQIIADSVAPTGSRLTTMVITFPRFLLAEMNTHREFSRNSASSRAIPVKKQIEKVKNDPVIPMFGQNIAGMQDAGPLEEGDRKNAEARWMIARDAAVNSAEYLAGLNVHKQVVNRILEPFMWHTAVITSARWSNFFAQRCNTAAQPEMQVIAGMMRSALASSQPKQLQECQWHLPFIQREEFEQFSVSELIRISTARCARVSYLGHDGVRDPQKDIELEMKLEIGNHWSPFEHQALAVEHSDPTEYGNFADGWIQNRKFYNNEYVR